MNILSWIQAFRLPFLSATIIPILLGTTIAWNQTNAINWLSLSIVFLGITFLHFGTNLANDYFDHLSKNDDCNKNFSPVNGGSRVIQDGLIDPKTILIAALICFCLGSIVGLYFVITLKSLTILLIGIFGVFCGFFYTAMPLKIGYKGSGELIVGICFGPLIVFGAYFVQTQIFSFTPIIASLPISILVFLLLYINEFPDYEADKAVGKNTLVVVLGKDKAIKLYQKLLLSAYIITATSLVFQIIPIYSLILIFTLPLALKAHTISKNNYKSNAELLPANFATIGLHAVFGVLLSLSFFLDGIF